MRELERKYNVARRTVRRALDSAWPEPRKRLPPQPSTLDPYKAAIDGILLADLDAPRKQRHTVTWTFHRLFEEHSADVFYPMLGRARPLLLRRSRHLPRGATMSGLQA
ncbi:hypothetical protein AB0K74_31865 [Streptomyces sp. NPDC056159]|uniref:hypothetical protein n=1 Tax=Streptomyces sp. NPDC056159 TaxID=3155537 RepID=UPI0034290D65